MGLLRLQVTGAGGNGQASAGNAVGQHCHFNQCSARVVHARSLLAYYAGHLYNSEWWTSIANLHGTETSEFKCPFSLVGLWGDGNGLLEKQV
jgi:hypothetical protein